MKETLSALEGKTLYISGGTGFFGKALIKFLNSLSWHKAPKVILSSRGKKQFSFEGELKVLHHVTDLKSADLSRYQIDYFIHAATSTDEEGNDNQYLKDIAEGTESILHQCALMKLAGFLYVSSGAVYGINSKEEEKITEEFALTGDSAYGLSKIEGEKLCADFFHRTSIPTTIARCFTFSGPDIDMNRPYAITSFLRQAMLGNKLQINGSGRAVRSYMDQNDMSAWLLSLLVLNRGLDYVNVGSPEGISISELAHKVSDMFKLGEPVILHKPDERENFYVPAVDKAMGKYRLRLTVSPEDSISAMIREYQKSFSS